MDSFCKEIFSGNPAAVCLLEEWLSEDILQSIAAENNLAETAFVCFNNNKYEIRWFTPTTEVDLCGHATLAVAHVFFTHKQFKDEIISFYSPRSGILNVRSKDGELILDFPRDLFKQVPVTDEMLTWFNLQPLEAYRGKTDYMLVFDSISNIDANLVNISRAIEVRGVIATSLSDKADFICRFFAPQSGIPEDPVTGSAHTTLTPYWSQRLGKKQLVAIQDSERKGFLTCHDLGERIEITGKAKTYLIGKILLNQ